MAVLRVVLVLAAFTTSYATNASPPVLVQVYGEAGCADCTYFIFHTLKNAQRELGADAGIMQIDWYPFGNAFYKTNASQCLTTTSFEQGYWNAYERDCYFPKCGLGSAQPAWCYSSRQIVCQHAIFECEMNRMEACAKEVWTPERSWEFTVCMEEAVDDWEIHSVQDAERRASACGVDSHVNACYSGEAGDKAMEKMARSTPPHSSVPHVLINGVHFEGDNLRTAVCNAINGPKPAGCGNNAVLDTIIFS